MRTRLKIQLKKLMMIVLGWTAIGFFQSFYDHFLLMSHLSAGFGSEYTLGFGLILNVASGFMGGIMGGLVLIFIVDRKYRSAPYYKGILVVCVAFVSIVSFLTLLMATAQTIANYGSINSPEAREYFNSLVFTTMHVKNIILWAIVVALTQMTLMIDNKFGHGLLWSMIHGKYHLPRVEDRVFMFLDLRSSTTIAEKLGNEKYHQLLKDLFAHITDPILDNRGEIYQYVGDEVVISWKKDLGLEDNNCVNCFFDIKEKLKAKSEKYLQKYNLQPEFKAGIHFGQVIAGEIGIIKRDITYSGDVLNTAARIQSKCNEYEVDILTSKSLVDQLMNSESLDSRSIGSISLRGKEEQVELVTIQ
jgi:adenylate cyclase